MQLLQIRNGALAALALALAACSGNGTVPTSSAGPGGMASSAVNPAKKPTASLCSSLANTWDFQGACKSVNLKSFGGMVQLKRYSGFAVNLAVHGSDATGKVPFLFGNATGAGDITGTFNSVAFPFYGTNCVDVSAAATPCSGTAFAYIEAVNTTQTAVNLTSSPRIVITNQKPYPGTTCTLAVLQSSGAWMITPLTAQAKKHQLMFKSEALPFSLPPGGLYLTIACQ
jgi:hypothetical protein